MAKLILQTSIMIMIWVNYGDGKGYFEEDGYDYKDVDAAAGDVDDDYSLASELVIGYGWSQHLLSITASHHITPGLKTCIHPKTNNRGYRFGNNIFALDHIRFIFSLEYLCVFSIGLG